MKIFLVITILPAVLFGAASCKNKEEKPVPRAQEPLSGLVASEPKTKAGLRVIVPESVKGRWSAVRIVAEDKAAKKIQEVNVNLNSEAGIPGSALKISIGDFLPDFKMGAGTITSSSNELNNPAVNATIYEGGKEIFRGWLFSKFPNIHPFEHPKYGITLKEGIKKG